ncbi:MAG: protein-disulfide reductase DsbD, partial [Gammaproteobacteria bacterium]
GAFAAGLLLTFTPCVLPMIPILSGVIAGQGDRLTRSRGGILALVYVLGTAATYAVMGAVAGATGEQLQAYFQNVWAIGILAAVFVVMALAMFGMFELQMPAAIQSRLQSSTSKMSGSIPLVFILGLVSALIIGACVSPVLISFLGLAVTKADPILGAQMMFVMAMGMGLPLIALGFGAGYLLPRAGAWMESVKYVFGVMLIGVAIYLLGVLPQIPVLLLWGVFFIIVSTYLGATQSLPAGSSGWHRFGKGFGTVLLVWGIAALVGGFYGERDIFKPLPATLFQAGTAEQTQSGAEAHLFTQVSDLAELEQEFSRAATENKRIMIDFYADWCVDCIKMDKSTFHDPSVTSILDTRYIALQVDVTDPNDEDTKAIKRKFGVFGPPAVLFFDSLGSPLDSKNFYGYQGPEQFLSLISE